MRSKQAPKSKVQEIPDGNFLLTVFWTDEAGLRQRTRHEYPTQKAAGKDELKAMQRIENGLPPFPETREEPWTVAEVLAYYHEHHVPDARPRSQVLLKAQRKRLEDFLGDYEAARELNYDALVRYRRNRKEESRRRREKPLSDVTVKKELSHLRAALRYAKVNGKIEAHVFERLDRNMRQSLFPNEDESKGRILEDADFEAILAEMSPQYHAPLRLARLTGMRKGEVCALDWSNVTRDKLSLTVSKTGPREIALTDDMKALLPPRQLVGGLVFRAPEGGSLYASLGAAWDRARRAAGLPWARVHDLRHSAATELERIVGRTEMSIALGMSPATAARYGGHQKVERGRAAFARVAEDRARRQEIQNQNSKN